VRVVPAASHHRMDEQRGGHQTRKHGTHENLIHEQLGNCPNHCANRL
jgi:hypothetical protein